MNRWYLCGWYLVWYLVSGNEWVVSGRFIGSGTSQQQKKTTILHNVENDNKMASNQRPIFFREKVYILPTLEAKLLDGVG